MKNNFSGNTPRTFVSIAMLLIAAGFFSACASETEAVSQEIEKTYLFEVESPQQVWYNGKPQAISYLYTGETKPDIIYYNSQSDQAEDRRGSRADPVNAGAYFVRLIRPGSDKTAPVKEFYAMFIIQKRPVKIEAEKPQAAVYDGNPKRIHATAEPAVPLSFSYYPNLELMETAKKSAAETSPGQSTFTQTFRGYRRIDRAPTEQGTYYVWIHYPGDENNESASLDVVFTILPPAE